MTATYCGEYTLNGAVPGAAASAAAGVSGINGALPDIAARIAALAAFAPQAVTFAAQLTMANAILTSIQTCIATPGLVPPSIATQIAAASALMADLLATALAVEASLTVVTDFQGLMASAGIHVVAFAGTTASFGTEVDAALVPAGLGIGSSGITLITDVSASWDAMQEIFRTTP